MTYFYKSKCKKLANFKEAKHVNSYFIDKNGYLYINHINPFDALNIVTTKFSLFEEADTYFNGAEFGDKNE